jgi:GAF domain-containing protein
MGVRIVIVRCVSWAKDRIQGAINHWVEGLIVLGLTTLALVLWKLLRHHHDIGGHLSIPTWLVAAAIGVCGGVILILAWRLRRRHGQLEELVGGVEGMVGAVRYAEQAREITAAYAEHLIEVLYAFQRVLAGDIPGVTIKEFIEDGILEPARDLIKTRQDEDVRLSILVPEDDDFVMTFAAGHTLESKKAFRLPIDHAFSKWAFRTSVIYWSGDLASDDRFTRHPRAAQERDYNSIISVPIRAGAKVVAVFNTIFTPPDAFDEADLLYVRLIGAAIELVWHVTDGPVP